MSVTKKYIICAFDEDGYCKKELQTTENIILAMKGKQAGLKKRYPYRKMTVTKLDIWLSNLVYYDFGLARISRDCGICRRPVVIVKGKLSVMKSFVFAYDEDLRDAHLGGEKWIFRFTKYYLDAIPYAKIVAFVGSSSCNWCEESVNEKFPDKGLFFKQLEKRRVKEELSSQFKFQNSTDKSRQEQQKLREIMASKKSASKPLEECSTQELDETLEKLLEEVKQERKECQEIVQENRKLIKEIEEAKERFEKAMEFGKK